MPPRRADSRGRGGGGLNPSPQPPPADVAMPDIADVVEASQSEIFSVIPRRSSRTRPPRRERPRPAEDAIILYRIGRVAKRVQNELEPLLDALHANEDIQEQCRLVTQNAGEFLRLQETEDGESSYVAVKCIPAGTRLAAYSGLLREAQPGPSTRRRHDMSIGDPGIGYQIVVDGSPGLSSQLRRELVKKRAWNCFWQGWPGLPLRVLIKLHYLNRCDLQQFSPGPVSEYFLNIHIILIE